MAVIKLIEDYTVRYARSCVRDNLMWWGEQSVLLQMWHPSDPGVGKCPRCYQAAYNEGEQMCPVCYGTGLFNDDTGTGGVRQASRVWTLFTDRIHSEEYGQRGVLEADNREVTTEAFPLLTEHDFIARVRNWDPVSHVALDKPRFYSLDAVTQQSLRTGYRYGQTWQDIIGQTAQLSWIPENTMGIQLYPVQGVAFPEAKIEGIPVPVVTPQPDTHVVFYPVTNASGQVIGGTPGNFEQTFTYVQQAPAQMWTISHTLGHLPSVSLTVGNEVVDADIDYPDQFTVVITFKDPQSGSAELI
jgi:hypothetical protein